MHSLGSAYGVILATGLFSLLSVPVALRHLERPEFGLWALMTQITGYFALFEFGMNSAVARFLIDFKEKPDDGRYGSLILTAVLVCLVQAVVLMVAGPFSARWLADVLGVDAVLRDEFVVLLIWNCALAGGALLIKPFYNVVYAHQRVDILNYAQIAGLAVGYAVMWVAFQRGKGVFSLVWGTSAAWLVNQLTILTMVATLKLLPRAGCWGAPSWKMFQEVFAYAKDVFLIHVGVQFIDASQVIVISRTMGLESAALWAVGTKAFQMLHLINHRMLGMSAPALCEMIARRETQRLRARFLSLVGLSVAFCAVAGAGLAACNSAFVTVWTQGKFDWPVSFDFLLAAALLANGLKDYFAGFIPMTKQVGAMKYVHIIEGGVFIVAGLAITPTTGLGGLIALSIACKLGITFAYGLWRVGLFLEMRPAALCRGWLHILSRMWVRLGVLIGASLWLTWHQGAAVRFGVGLVLVTVFGAVWVVRLGLGSALQAEMGRRMPGWLRGMASRIAPGFRGARGGETLS